MAIFNYEFHNLDDVFIQQLKGLYDAEQQLTEALPLMEKAAATGELKQAFADHFRQTQIHVRRLEQVFQSLNCEADTEKCAAMSALIKEGNDIMSAKGDASVRDAGLIAAAQKVEHFEIASYGTVRNWARHLGRNDLAQLLQQTLNEEEQTDKRLTAIAESEVNQMAHA